MKNIAIIFPKDSVALFNPKSEKTFGGATVQMFNLAACFKESANVLSVITKIGGEEDCLLKEINGHLVFNSSDSVFTKAYKLINFLRSNNNNVIIQHGMTYETAMLSFVSKCLGIKYLFMFAHDVEVEGRFQSSGKRNYLFNFFLRTNPLLICQNDYQKSKLLKSGYISQRVNNGFVIPAKINKKFESYVLWVSRCEKWKQPEVCIEIAKQLSDIKFVMIAPQVNKEYFENIRATAEKIKNIEFIPFVNFREIDKYYRNASLFLNTSTHEGFPQSFIQASMNSVPIVSLIVDPDNIFKDHRLGLCASGDIGCLIKSLDELAKDPELYKRYSDNAYKYAVNFHDIKNTVTTINKLI